MIEGCKAVFGDAGIALLFDDSCGDIGGVLFKLGIVEEDRVLDIASLFIRARIKGWSAFFFAVLSVWIISGSLRRFVGFAQIHVNTLFTFSIFDKLHL